MAAAVIATKPKQITGDTLDVFYGEFLVSPIPLELSFNWCSHSCFYCFANLNKPNRWADVKATMRLLQDFQHRDTLAATLLKQGYPVLVSNRVDPFAASNYQQAVPVMQAMIETGIPLAIQTKGGRGVNDILALLPPSVWYVSISMLDDALRRKLEPGAPSIGSRLALIATLREHGHRVVLGLNPCVPEWLPDPMLLLRQAKEWGAEAVWIQQLHFNPKQVANLSERERQACGSELMQRALRRKCSPEDSAHCERAAALTRSLGMHVYAGGWHQPSGYQSLYRDCYPKTFPVMNDFITHCAAKDDLSALIPFDEFAEALPGLPSGTFALDHYIGATAHHLMRSHSIPKRMSYRQLLKLIWSQPGTKQNPVRFPVFAYAAEREREKWIEWQDDEELPFLLYDPKGFDDYYCEVKPV